MRILFIAHPYLDLYKSISEELINQGHEVVTILEEYIPGDPYYKQQKYIKRLYSIWKFKRDKVAEKYWEKKLKDKVFNCHYDLLFVIQGYTFHPMLLEHLRRYNIKIKTSLYIWDSNVMYDFFRNVPYFDKVFSFDFEDVKKYKKRKIDFLPFFWDKNIEKLDKSEIYYDICSIGTNHDNRYSIYKKVIKQISELSLQHYIRLIQFGTQPLSLKQKLIYFCTSLIGSNDIKQELDVTCGNVTDEWIEQNFYPPTELLQIMGHSRAVLDTDNPRQHGTTPRLIWALALNKHIYTTNEDITLLPFYQGDSIHIISRKDPIIDFSYLNKTVYSRESILYLRIDNWVRNFL